MIAALWRFNGLWDYYDSFVVGNALGLFFIPIVLILLLGEEPASFGFCLGESRKVRFIVGLMFVGLLAAFVPASRLPAFQDYYPIFKHFGHFPMIDRSIQFRGYGPFIEGNMGALIYGWMTYGMYMLFWEFFFRGFLLFGLARTIKWPAVIVQALAFGLMHLGKPWPEVAASFGAGIILGVLALRAKSFVPGFILHWMAFVTFDALVIISR
jgi:membrane protease YdiL (CAAX protease family)